MFSNAHKKKLTNQKQKAKQSNSRVGKDGDRQFTGEEALMANHRMKRQSPLQEIRESQVQTGVRSN